MKMLAKTGSEYSWCKITSIDMDTYIMPVYVGYVLHGKHIGEKIATTSPMERVPSGTFISHEYPSEVNTA